MTPKDIELPDADSYTYVMQRYDRAVGGLHPPIRFAAGNVNILSKEMPSVHQSAGKDEMAHTLFFPKVGMAQSTGVEAAMMRAQIFGWHDVTRKWEAWLSKRPDAPAPERVTERIRRKDAAETEAKGGEQAQRMTMEKLAGLPFRDLQQLAKSLSVKAGGARADLEERVFKAMQD